MESLTTLPPDINIHWSAIAPLLTIRNEEEYGDLHRILHMSKIEQLAQFFNI